jgi:hypothetical protein
MRLIACGLGIGLGGAFMLTRYIESLLYGVKPTDPLTFGGVALLLLGVALLATTLLERGMPIDQIQKFLGHSKLDPTQVYAESSAEMIKESYRKALSE